MKKLLDITATRKLLADLNVPVYGFSEYHPLCVQRAAVAKACEKHGVTPIFKNF